MSCKLYLHIISTKEQKLINIITLSEFELNLYSCCQFEKYYIIIGEENGFASYKLSDEGKIELYRDYKNKWKW